MTGLNNHVELALCVLILLLFVKAQRIERNNERSISVRWGEDSSFILEGYSHKETLQLGKSILNKEAGPNEPLFS